MAGSPLAPVLLGRQSQLDALNDVLDRARNGHSSMLVISGEAGVGKSALVNQVITGVKDMRIARVVGVEAEMELTFAGLHQLCAPVLDHQERLPAVQRDALGVALGLREGRVPDRLLVGLAVLTLLAHVAANRPLVCVIDDAQWLDQASLQALSFCARRLFADPVAMIFVVRESIKPSALRGLPELSIPRLSDHDARILLNRVIPGRIDERVRERFLAEAQGNPLALLELPRAFPMGQLAGGYGMFCGGPVESRLEESLLSRLRGLPSRTRTLLLVAATDPVGEAATLWRTAERLGIGVEAARPAEEAGFVSIGTTVRFRHPLLRSTVYRSAPLVERRHVHRAMAEVLDAAADSDRRAWHRAHAVEEPDEEVAVELEESADRARARGGVAAAAAFLAFAADMTPVPSHRVMRILAAGEAKLQAGEHGAVLNLLATAEALALSEVEHARIELLRVQVAAARSGSEGAPLLLAAAERLTPLDPRLARETYLRAMSVAIFRGRFLGAEQQGLLDVARAALQAPPAPRPPRAADLLLDCLAARFVHGYAVAVPLMKRALQEFRREDTQGRAGLQWYYLAGQVAADLWDVESYEVLAIRHVRLLREAGDLNALPLALNHCAGVFVDMGCLADAEALVAEAGGIARATGAAPPGYLEAVISAYHGREELTLELAGSFAREAMVRGGGRTISSQLHALAILHNNLGHHQAALAASRAAAEHDELGLCASALLDLVDSAIHSCRLDLATEATREIITRAEAAGTIQGLGYAARCRALISEGPEGEPLFQEAIARFKETGHFMQVARTYLHYGEWLRRVNRHVDAREQLRIAQSMFVRMGAEGFAERIRRELLAAGESADPAGATLADGLTAQESVIARLASDGHTNAEIAAQLFISRRTVEWHLSKIFSKLNVTSRGKLKTVLPGLMRSQAARSSGADVRPVPDPGPSREGGRPGSSVSSETPCGSRRAKVSGQARL